MEPQEHEPSRVRDARGRWQKGSSGNPGGRKRERSLLAELEGQLQQRQPDGRPKAAHIAEMLVDAALAGDLRAAMLVLERFAPKEVAVAQALASGEQLGGVVYVTTGVERTPGEGASELPPPTLPTLSDGTPVRTGFEGLPSPTVEQSRPGPERDRWLQRHGLQPADPTPAPPAPEPELEPRTPDEVIEPEPVSPGLQRLLATLGPPRQLDQVHGRVIRGHEVRAKPSPR